MFVSDGDKTHTQKLEHREKNLSLANIKGLVPD